MTSQVFWTTEPFAVKTCVFVHCHEPECCVKSLNCYLQEQGHKDRHVVFKSKVTETDLLSSRARSQSCLQEQGHRDRLAVFKGKVTKINLLSSRARSQTVFGYVCSTTVCPSQFFFFFPLHTDFFFNETCCLFETRFVFFFRVQWQDVCSGLVAAVRLGPALLPFLGHVQSAVLSPLFPCLPLQCHVLWSVNCFVIILSPPSPPTCLGMGRVY